MIQPNIVPPLPERQIEKEEHVGSVMNAGETRSQLKFKCVPIRDVIWNGSSMGNFGALVTWWSRVMLEIRPLMVMLLFKVLQDGPSS